MNGRTLTVSGNLKLSSPVLEIMIEGQDYSCQMIRHDGAGNLRVRFRGTVVSTKILLIFALSLDQLFPTATF